MFRCAFRLSEDAKDVKVKKMKKAIRLSEDAKDVKVKEMKQPFPNLNFPPPPRMGLSKNPWAEIPPPPLVLGAR